MVSLSSFWFVGPLTKEPGDTARRDRTRAAYRSGRAAAGHGQPTVRVHRADRLPDALCLPDVYFTPGYGRAATMMDGGEWILLEAYAGAWQVPLIVRTLVDGTKDAISPYGYSGAYASPSLSSVQIQEAWSATVTCLRKLGVISLLLRQSPLVSQASSLPGLLPVVSGHPTIAVETADTESAWNGLISTCRTRIRKARKNGYTGHVRQASSQDLEQGSHFRQLYEQTMRRLDAAPMYFFGDDYYRALLDGLGENLLITEVLNADGMPVSSALLMRHGDLLHYHLSGSNVEDARMGTNNLMLWTATEYAAEQGLRQFYLGGGLHQRDNLFRFKHTFGGRELEYGVSGLIIDDAAYQDKVETRAKECDTTPDELFASGYFPAYRGGHAA